MTKPIHCIAGPTASGKSRFAIKLAKSCDGEIVNADALQVYQQLRILSARPTEDEMEGIPHHLFGHIDAGHRYSAGAWVREVVPVIRDIQSRGKTPIIVGGTGLYFKALTEGLAEIPPPSSEAVDAAQTLLDEKGLGALRKKALDLDPIATARVLGHDPQRLLRIVSVALGTEKPLSVWQAHTRPILSESEWHGIALMPPRAPLYERINTRYGQMVEHGGLAEAKNLHRQNLNRQLPALKAIGVRELLLYFDGEYTLDFAIEKAKQETRRFAKRQFTWLRGNMGGWETRDPFAHPFSTPD